MNARLVGWRGVNKMISDHPLIGTGPGTFATVYTQYQPPGLANRRFYAHNDYLHFISEVGLALPVVMVWLVIALYRKGFKKLKNPSRLVRGSTIGAMAGITAILVHSISDFNLYIPSNAILFTVLAALVAGPVPLDNVSRIRIDSTMKKPALISPQPSAVYQTE
jgi:O-antigen ligase